MHQRANPTIDHERLFRLIHDQEWREAAALLHRHHRDVADDPLLHRASTTFVDGLTAVLEDDALPADALLLEQLFLLHQGQFLNLPPALFERVIVRLVQASGDRPEAALAYARFCPQHPTCAAALEQLGDPVREHVEHEQMDAITVQTTSSGASDGTRALFRSAQEEAFFRAVRDVFPTYFVYPNVALAAVLDFDRMKDRLSREERRYFFHALVDCVVFDQQNGYQPELFVELDSPLHDDAERKKRDLLKERILAAAGQRLYRIRSQGAAPSPFQFARLVRETVAQDMRKRRISRPTLL